MSCYQRRRSDGEVRRWDSKGEGTWYVVPSDEPETRVRVNEGMVLVVVDEFYNGPLTLSIDGVRRATCRS